MTRQPGAVSVAPAPGGMGGYEAAPNAAYGPRVAQRLRVAASANSTWLGVSVSPVPPAMAAQLRLRRGHGVVVDNVIPGSPAQRAGIEQYDLIETLDGMSLHDPQQFSSLIASRQPGNKITLTVIREGERMEIQAKLARTRRQMMYGPVYNYVQPGAPVPYGLPANPRFGAPNNALPYGVPPGMPYGAPNNALPFARPGAPMAPNSAAPPYPLGPVAPMPSPALPQPPGGYGNFGPLPPAGLPWQPGMMPPPAGNSFRFAPAPLPAQPPATTAPRLYRFRDQGGDRIERDLHGDVMILRDGQGHRYIIIRDQQGRELMREQLDGNRRDLAPRTPDGNQHRLNNDPPQEDEESDDAGGDEQQPAWHELQRDKAQPSDVLILGQGELRQS